GFTVDSFELDIEVLERWHAGSTFEVIETTRKTPPPQRDPPGDGLWNQARTMTTTTLSCNGRIAVSNLGKPGAKPMRGQIIVTDGT
ncbi:MAG: hypothetical protein LBF50_07510, partial [Azoarcus sp.]|nr:hypothetical protein [Azoarcus sp.]